MLTQAELLRKRVDKYLATSRMPPTTFGKLALGDPNFVRDLREGREPRSRIVRKVLSFIAEAQKASPQGDKRAA